MPFICSLLISGLINSPVLITALPRVRRLALRETIQAIVDNNSDSIIGEDDRLKNEKALKITLESVATSPYLSQENFIDAVLQELTSVVNQLINSESDTEAAEYSGLIINFIADSILQKYWPTVLEIAQTAEIVIPLSEQQQEEPHMKFRRYRDMVIAIFSSSRKMTTMVDIDRRRMISQRIHSTDITTVEELNQIAIELTSSSQIFDTLSGRSDVLNCILEGRFDQLLLPQYFDCDERSRRSASRQDEDYIHPGFNQSPSETPNEASIAGVEDHTTTFINEESEESDFCVICLSELAADTRTLDCNHTYCTVCINSWLNNGASCPTCRTPVKPDTSDNN